jgi:hypothetical protein
VNLLAFILIIVCVSAVVAFAMARFIRTNWLCIVSSAIVAESLMVLYGLVVAADSRYPDTALLGVIVTLIFGTPVFIGSTIGFTFLARRL